MLQLKAVAYLEFGLGGGGVRSRIGYIQKKNKLRPIDITIFKVGEISLIKVNCNNTTKIRVIENTV